MKIEYTYVDIAKITEGTTLQGNSQKTIENIVYDTRKISFGEASIFICLKTKTNDGHAYIEEAYSKGVRAFLVDTSVPLINIPDATIIEVPSVLQAVQKWAKHHRDQFDIPVIGITGSAGKTVVKEWLYHLLSDNFTVARSPKSFNSQLGVALSLFEINRQTELALIEVGISEKGEMFILEQIVQPTVGVLTSFSSAHRDNFASEEDHWSEKLILFKNCQQVYVSGTLRQKNFGSLEVEFAEESKSIPDNNKALISFVASKLGLAEGTIQTKIQTLPAIALRMETFEGNGNNTILLDAYNLSFDGLEQALAQQMANSSDKDRYLFLAKEAHEGFDQTAFDGLLNQFQMKKSRVGLDDIIIFSTTDFLSVEQIKNGSLLFKGSNPKLKRIAVNYKARKHSTFIEISVSALKNNIKVWKNRLPKTVHLMAMVKASSYGSELTKMGNFLDQQKVDYLGVAYVDEGVELRKSGIKLPIMVMNSERSTWPDCVQYNLEPAVYSFEQMEELIKEFILLDVQNFPIHLKFDTGMHRLGFFMTDLPKVISNLKTQPEIKVKSVFTHLADADNSDDTSFTIHQLKEFQKISETLQNNLPYPFLRHALNTEGLSNFPEYGFDMVRLGIGLYGISSNENVSKQLQPVLSWKSKISQIKTLDKGDTVGYGRSFLVEEEIKIAIIPVGYADGYNRFLSNGKGGVYIDSVFCPTVGRVCMDMIMVDITGNNFDVEDEVEIIGDNQSITQMANLCQTIPYEIMTSLSTRMPRIFVDDVD